MRHLVTLNLLLQGDLAEAPCMHTYTHMPSHAFSAVSLVFTLLSLALGSRNISKLSQKHGAAMGNPSADYRVDNDGVAVIALSYPPVNALHPQGVHLFVCRVTGTLPYV